MSILTGYRPTVGVAIIILFLAPVTLMMHNFWVMDDPQMREMELRSFLVNVALAGSALLSLGVPQPWTWSVEALADKPKSTLDGSTLSPAVK
jgi:hypothetical protein